MLLWATHVPCCQAVALTWRPAGHEESDQAAAPVPRGVVGQKLEGVVIDSEDLEGWRIGTGGKISATFTRSRAQRLEGKFVAQFASPPALRPKWCASGWQ